MQGTECRRVSCRIRIRFHIASTARCTSLSIHIIMSIISTIWCATLLFFGFNSSKMYEMLQIALAYYGSSCVKCAVLRAGLRRRKYGTLWSKNTHTHTLKNNGFLYLNISFRSRSLGLMVIMISIGFCFCVRRISWLNKYTIYNIVSQTLRARKKKHTQNVRAGLYPSSLVHTINHHHLRPIIITIIINNVVTRVNHPSYYYSTSAPHTRLLCSNHARTISFSLCVIRREGRGGGR